MTRTIVRLFDNRHDAMEAAHELERMGVRHEDVSMVASNRDNWFDGDGKKTDGTKMKDADRDGRDDRAEGAAKGATTGGIVGAGAGLLAGLGLLAIPGLGPVVAAGWLMSTAAGAVAGGAVGGLVGALTKAGVSEEDAHVYSEGVRRGGTLLTVRADDARASEIEGALNRYRPTDVSTRGQEYRAAGWSRFDPDAPPPPM